jgi:hypothetical protein
LFPLRGLLAGCGGLAGALVLTAAPAGAAVTEFGSAGEGAGQFIEPHGVAVDNGLADPSAGDAYVADRNNDRVDVFGPAGEFRLAWGWGVASDKPDLQTCGPDASPATATCDPGLSGGEAGELDEPEGVAVDDSTNPLDLSKGDVYVEDVGDHRVDKFTSDGTFILMFGGEVDKTKVQQREAEIEHTGTSTVTREEEDVCTAASKDTCQNGSGEGEGPGEFERLPANTIAVDGEGTVYVGGVGRVQEFSEAGAFVRQVTLAGLALVEALAVDAAGDVYAIGETGGVREYEPCSAPLCTGREVGRPRDPSANGYSSAIALGSGELFVDDGSRVGEYEPAGEQVASFPSSASEESIRGLAYSDGAGGLYVLAFDEATGATRVRLRRSPPAGPLIESEQATAEPVGAVTVRASIDPEGKRTEYHLDYGLQDANETATKTEVLTAKEFEPETVEVKLEGLTPGASYHFHFVASNTSAPPGNSGADETFTVLPAVGIESESVSRVTASSARLEASINPLTLPTEYHFEYGPEACASAVHACLKAPLSDASAGSGAAGVPVSVLIDGLASGSTYHYRVVAHNHCNPAVPAQVCVVEGADRTFTTQAGEAPGLIDGRGWELVSPPDKHGVALEAMTLEGGAIQAAADGSGLAYIGKAPVDSRPAGSRSFASQQLLATRVSPGAFSTQDIAAPHEGVAGLGGVAGLSEYKLFSPDLSGAVLEPEGVTPLSPAASERTPYVRDDAACEPAPAEAIPAGCYTPLVTGCPRVGEPCPQSVSERADVPPGTRFGLEEFASKPGVWEPGTGVELVTATADLDHVLIEAPQSLVQGFKATGEAAKDSLYEWSASAPPNEQLAPVSVLPDEASAAVAEGEAFVGHEDANVRNAVSEDGSRVFFETQAEGHLYVRDMEKSETVRLDEPEAGLGGVHGRAAVYQDSGGEGERAFFTDSARLTQDSTAAVAAGGKPEPDLYMCEVGALAAGEPSCVRHLRDLTVAASAAEPADVLGTVLGASEDGSYVYFAANGILSNAGVPVAGAIHGDCTPEEGILPSAAASCNLYVWHNGETRLVAVLSNRDFPDWEAGNVHDDLTKLTSRVAPNGRFLAFMSQRSLTGYDNRDVNGGEPDEEVYEYDADSGRVVCASCDPAGARPRGVLDPGFEEPSLLIDRAQAWANQWLAASVPGWTAVKKGLGLYQSRYLDDEGRLFFDSSVGLVPGDGNGTQDVYEFEPEGIGGCASATSSASVVFKPARRYEAQGAAGARPVAGEEPAGCVGLVSSGTSSEESVFLDASESGEDVFFLTAAQLAPKDTDSALDVYDAHVCTSAAPCPPASATVPPSCTTADSCRAAPAPQPEIFGAPATATLGGAGNPPAPPAPKPKAKGGRALNRAQKLAKALKVCHHKDKRNKSKRERCERAAHRKYGPVKKSRKGGRR